MRMMFAIFFILAIALTGLIANASYLNKIVTSGDTTHPLGVFYGYQHTGAGPGADAFQKCLTLAKTDHVPLLIVYSNDDCETCSSWCDDMYLWERAYGPMMGLHSTVNAYFRVTDTASLEALSFLQTKLGAGGQCHILGMYGVYEDGVEFKSVTTLPTTYISFGTWKKNQGAAFMAAYEKHKYTSPKASAAFACEKQMITEGVAP